MLKLTLTTRHLSLRSPRGSVEGIMFLPYGEHDDEQQCMHTFESNGGDKAEAYQYKGANSFIRYTYNISASIRSIMKEIIKNKGTLLDAVL